MTTTIKKESLAVLLRVSTPGQAEEGYSLTYQLSLAEKKAEELNLDIVEYNEADTSGAALEIADRPVLQKLFTDIQSGLIRHVFAYELSRFTRDEVVTALFNRACRKHGVMIYTPGSKYNLNLPAEKLGANIIQVVAQYERELTIQRMKLGLETAAKRGTWIGCMIPMGFRKEGVKKGMRLLVDQEESKVYLKMVDWSLEGVSCATIAKRLNEMNIPTKGSKTLKNRERVLPDGSVVVSDGINVVNKYTGKKRHIPSSELQWAPNTVLNVLKNPLYKGERMYKGTIIPFEPALIDPDKWQQLQDNFAKNRVDRSKNTKHFYLLRGLIRCGCPDCNRNMLGYVKTDPKKFQRVYMCSSRRLPKEKHCKTKAININRLDSIVWQTITNSKSFLQKLVEEISVPVDEVRLEQLQKENDKRTKEQCDLNKRRERNLNLYRNGHITELELNKKALEYNLELKDIDEKINSITQEIEAINSKSVNKQSYVSIIKSVGNRIKKYTNKQKQVIVQAMIRNITITYEPVKFIHNVKMEINYSNVIKTAVVSLNKQGETNMSGIKMTVSEQTLNSKFKLPVMPAHLMNEAFGGGFISPTLTPQSH